MIRLKITKIKYEFEIKLFSFLLIHIWVRMYWRLINLSLDKFTFDPWNFHRYYPWAFCTMMKFFFLFFNAKLSKCALYEMSKLSKYSSQTLNSNSSFVIFFAGREKLENRQTKPNILEKDI